MTAATPSAAPTDDGRLAFLIVAHHQPDHLARLVRALDGPGCYTFIHVDAKEPLAPFKAAAPERHNVVFLDDRLEVEWGKLSVVQATLALIDRALASGQAFRYFNLLSGSDYPTKPIGEIVARLMSSDRQHMRVDRRLTSDPAGSHQHVLRDLPGRRYFGDLTPYHGSMYWSLTADYIRYVRGFLNGNPGFLEFHRRVATPDEVLFHTVIKQSPFAASITQDYSDAAAPNQTDHANHFIDWSVPWPNANLILDERNLGDLLASDCLFARKFDETKSARLLDMLDQLVHRRHRERGDNEEQ